MFTVQSYLLSQLFSKFDCKTWRWDWIIFRDVSKSDKRFLSQSIVKLSTVNLLGNSFPEVSSTRFSSKLNLMGDNGLVLIK